MMFRPLSRRCLIDEVCQILTDMNNLCTEKIKLRMKSPQHSTHRHFQLTLYVYEQCVLLVKT